MRIPLVGSSSEGVTVSLDSQRTTNLWEEFADSKFAKSQSALIASPGLRWLADADGTNKALFTGKPVRGLYEMPPLEASTLGLSPLLVITSTKVMMVAVQENHFIATGEVNYSYSDLKTLTAKYTRAEFAESPTEVVMVVGGNVTVGYAFSINTASWTISAALIFDAVAGDYVPLADIVYLADFFLGWCNVDTTSSPRPGRQIFYSVDGTSWSALDYFEDAATADVIKKLIVKNGHLWVFKGRSVPIYAPTGDGNNPFAPLETSTINYGCVDGHTVAREGDVIYWVGNDNLGSGLQVFRTVGSTAERCSNAFVENILQQAITLHDINGLAGISAYCCIERGHPFYKLSIPSMGTTLCFDQLTNKWHERRWWNADTGEYEAEVGWVHANFNKLSIVGDRRLDAETYAAIYQMSEAFNDNQIQPLTGLAAHPYIPRERIGAHISGQNGERLFISEIELDFEAGLAPPNGQGSDPTVTLEISRDGGATYGNARTRSIGKVGEYKRQVRFALCGSAYDFVPKISMTDPIAWKLIAAYAEIEAET